MQKTWHALNARLTILDASLPVLLPTKTHGLLTQAVIDILKHELDGGQTEWEESLLESILKKRLHSTNSYKNTKGTKQTGAMAEEDKPVLSKTALSPTMVKQLELETPALLQEYSLTASELTTTEASLTQVTRLQATLAFHIATQATQIDRLWDEAAVHSDAVRKGNLQLEKAKAEGMSGGLRDTVIFAILMLAIALLLLHWITP